jgi:hypothetical protein
MNVITSKRSNRPLKTHISVLEFALHLLLVLSFWETVVGFTPSTTGTFRVPTLLPVAYVSSHSTVGGYTNGVPENSSQRLSVRSPVWTNAQSRFSSEKLAVARFQPTLAQATKNIFSATLYASTALATSGLIRSVMKTILSLVPTWVSRTETLVLQQMTSAHDLTFRLFTNRCCSCVFSFNLFWFCITFRCLF